MTYTIGARLAFHNYYYVDFKELNDLEPALALIRSMPDQFEAYYITIGSMKVKEITYPYGSLNLRIVQYRKTKRIKFDINMSVPEILELIKEKMTNGQ